MSLKIFWHSAVKEKNSNGNGDAPAKKCPECLALIHAAYQICPECGYEFPAPQRSNITEHASRSGIISGEVFFDEYDVSHTFYCVHEKRYADPVRGQRIILTLCDTLITFRPTKDTPI